MRKLNSQNIKRVLEITKYGKNASQPIAEGMTPGAAAKLGGQNGHNQQIFPATATSITAELPMGKPVVPMFIPRGLPVEDIVPIVIDTRALYVANSTSGTPSQNKTQIILFDEGQYYAKGEGFSGNPENVVYIGSPQRNLYGPWVSEQCSHAYILDGINVDVSAMKVEGAATEKQQLNEQIKVHRRNVKLKDEGYINLRNYKDSKDVDQDQRLVPLTDANSRIDRQVSWDWMVYDGMVINLDLHISAKVQF